MWGRQGEEWYRPRRVLSRKMLPLNEVLTYVDVMNQVAEDFIDRLSRVRHQLSELTQDTSTTLEHELLQFGVECIYSFIGYLFHCGSRNDCVDNSNSVNYLLLVVSF